MNTADRLSVTNHDIRRGHQVLARLMRINTGLGGAVRRMHDHEAEHGRLPADELRTLAALLYDVAAEVHEYAEQLDRPVIQAVMSEVRILRSGRP